MATHSYNDKLFSRNFQLLSSSYNKNINRICNERNFEEKKYNSDDEDDKSLGEITGNAMSKSSINRGMPMRSQYHYKKEMYDANKYLDFNLYDEKPSKKKMEYNDSNNNYTSYADLQSSSINMTEQINPIYSYNKSVEKFGTVIFNYLLKEFNSNSMAICSYGIHTLFSLLYIYSSGKTKNEIQKCFNLPIVNVLEKGFNKVQESVYKYNRMFNIKNFFIFGNNIPFNKNTFKQLNNYCNVITININEPKNEAIKLTALINKLIGTQMRNPISESTLQNLQLLFLTVGTINVIWTHPFDFIVDGIYRNIKTKYLVLHGKTNSYYEDNERQVLELKCEQDGNMLYGIILYKNNIIAESNKNIQNYVEHLKQITLDEVKIPCFTQDYKIRLTNVLKNIGLTSVYQEIIAENLFPEGNIVLHDVLQNIKVIVNDSTFNVPYNSKGIHSITKFIASKPFFYYLRCNKTNTILLNGYYC